MIAQHKSVVMLNSVCAAIVDVVIAGAIIIKIQQAERGFNPATDSLLVRIAAMTLTTASLSALLAVVAAILAAQTSIDVRFRYPCCEGSMLDRVAQAQLAYISLNLVLPRVNAISLVYSLCVSLSARGPTALKSAVRTGTHASLIQRRIMAATDPDHREIVVSAPARCPVRWLLLSLLRL